MRINIKSGLLRLYFLLWAAWASTFSLLYYQSYLENKAYQDWTPEKATAEANERCAVHLMKNGVKKFEDLPKRSYFDKDDDEAINCASIPLIAPYPPKEFSVRDYIRISFIAPLAILVGIYVVFLASKWIYEGFFEEKK